MGKIKIEEVKTRFQERKFIKLPWKIYKDDTCWVPPLISDVKKSVRGKNNTLKKDGPFTLLLAYKDNKVCGRLLVGINEHLNRAKNYKRGYISLFECVDNREVAFALFDYAINWLKERGIKEIIGPLSLPSGDDYRGLLIDNFTDSPLVMNTYNKEYYVRFFEDYGFEKYWDCYAYYCDLSTDIDERYRRIVPYAMKKHNFRVDMLDLKNINKEMMDIKEIIEKAMPEDWEDFIPPTDEDIKIIAKNLVPVADPELIYIARTNDGRPIGFNIALPDYNQVLKKLKGKLFPFGIIKFLFYRKKINRARLFVLFVVPEFRKKGVSSAIYLKVFDAARKKGYKYGEGSTIWEYNTVMKRDIEKFGGKIYKTYRIFKKDI
jgi:GNAT superfamily N-acetyltransferase